MHDTWQSVISRVSRVSHAGPQCDKHIQSCIRIDKFKLECTSTHRLEPPHLLSIESSCHAQNSSAIRSYGRSNSSKDITFDCVLFNQFDSVFWSNISRTCHILLVGVANTRHMTYLTFAQARWWERESETRRIAQLSQETSIPWTLLPMPAADATQRRVSIYRNSRVRTNVWTICRRVCGRVCHESLRVHRLVIILAEDVQTYIPSPTSTIGKNVL